MNKRIFLFFILMAIYPAQPTAIEQLSLQVVCELAEHRYRIDLTAAETRQIETECASDLARLLGKKISFLNFVAGELGDNKLNIKLGKTGLETDPNAIRAVNFEIEVSGADVKNPGEAVIWEFRSIADYLDVPSAETFADAISVTFGEILEHSEKQLVENQLGRLQIAGSAYPMPNDESWLMPFSREELGTANNSAFNIKAALIFQNSVEQFTYQVILFGDFTVDNQVPTEFHHKVKAMHMGDDKLSKMKSIERLAGANNVRVEYVTISRYVPITQPEQTSPSSLNLDGSVQ